MDNVVLRSLLQDIRGDAAATATDQVNAGLNNPAESRDSEEFWPSDIGGLASCGVFAWLAALITGYQIFLHATNYEDPVIQKYYIRIIIFIPVYAICSFFSLAFPGASVYVETVRDMYEAFVIYSFISLLLEFIGGPGNVEAYCRDRTIRGSLLFGTCMFPTMQVDGQFVKFCKRLVLQFVIVIPVLTVLTIVLHSQDLYTEGLWRLDSSYTWIQVIYNFTYGAALLGLIHFWDGTRTLLKPYKPVWKFLTVKGVVFITFWQGLLISLAMISQPGYKAKQLHTWLLCIEMLPAAIAMWFAFPVSQYLNRARNREQGGIMMAVKNVGNVVMFTDVVTDLKHQFRPQYSTYTCYQDVDQDSAGNNGQAAPSGQYRHATYVIKDPFQEQQIAKERSRQGQAPSNGFESNGANGASTSHPHAVPVTDLFNDMQEVPLEGSAAATSSPPQGQQDAQASRNPFMTDL